MTWTLTTQPNRSHRYLKKTFPGFSYYCNSTVYGHALLNNSTRLSLHERPVVNPCFKKQSTIAAIEQFSACLAKDLGERGITVNPVLPGMTDTDGLVMDEEQVNQLIAQTPRGRLGEPEDVANAVALLVSEDAHWITGQDICANGGIV